MADNLKTLLQKFGTDKITDDLLLMEKELEIFREYCLERKFEISEEDMQLITDRGLRNSFQEWKEAFEQK